MSRIRGKKWRYAGLSRILVCDTGDEYRLTERSKDRQTGREPHLRHQDQGTAGQCSERGGAKFPRFSRLVIIFRAASKKGPKVSASRALKATA